VTGFFTAAYAVAVDSEELVFICMLFFFSKTRLLQFLLFCYFATLLRGGEMKSNHGKCEPPYKLWNATEIAHVLYETAVIKQVLCVYLFPG